MTKNFPTRYEGEVQIDFDPVVPCAWLPDREVKLSEYNHMITYFVQKHIEENTDAITVCTEKFANR
jgi:hypothetical protein